ncbi:MAG: cysteine--tRNA ligase [Alphaproteobacteria bacterium]|nr:cysteine--tRNA ligase [Alphaproteobacteria bacterium]
MTMHIYNTLTRQKEAFTPIDAKNIRIYACGPTVYNFAHIGNARPAVIFALLADLLKYIYGTRHVTYVRNITDIDDKIINAAKETGAEISEITEKYTRIYQEDMGALGASAPDQQPKATDHITHMLLMIEKLLNRDHAYVAEGHVLFNVPSYKNYGALSGQSRDDMIAGARVEVAPYKKDPADFVLWKPSSDDQPGWDSPWGRGRPGWHLECSAMNAAIFGETFDIHAGGTDLIFPHHENEIAQSTCAHDGKLYAKYWMHNGHLMVDGKKMSKSLGNFLLVHDLLKDHPPEVLRYVLLSAHYRQPFDFTQDAIQQAKNTLDRYYNILNDAADVDTIDTDPPAAVLNALKDDLNTPEAFAALSQAAKRLASASASDKEQAKGEMLAAGKLLGLLQQSPAAWLQSGTEQSDVAAIEKLVAEMKTARANKDYAASDAIRDKLSNTYDVTVSIKPDGISWRKNA